MPATSQVRAQAIPGALNTGPTCQSYQSMSSRQQKPPINLIQFTSRPHDMGGSKKRFTAPLMHYLLWSANIFPQMVLFEVSNARLFPAEIHTQTLNVLYFRGKEMFHDRGTIKVNRYSFGRCSWAFAIHRFWPLWSGRHLFADCCNIKIWILFSALLLFCQVHHALYNSLSQVLSNRGV